MKLFTKEIERKLKANGNKADDGTTKPVVKLFHPMSGATWLLTEMDDYGLCYGLCDLGQGFPELGYVSREELETVKAFGLGVERDLYFKPKKTLIEYANEAWKTGRIVA